MTEQQDRDEDLPSQAETGSLGAGGGAGSMAGQRQSGPQEQAVPEQGGESWEGRSRDIGTDGWTTGDAGFGSTTADDGGPNRDDSAGAGNTAGGAGSGEQTERS